MTSTTVYTRHSLTSAVPPVSFENNQVKYEAQDKPELLIEAGLQTSTGLIIPCLLHVLPDLS
jgi:hypothetical protein